MRLQDLRGPADLKHASLHDLEELSQDIRQVILETVARNGGHLAPNLGVVELTLALHVEFNSPRDKILWDVSHQSYPHKLITGRLGRFDTLRQTGGIAGFTDPKESEHDHFHWGHASTSISAAVGLAKARDLQGQDHEVVAVIGDGALTGGLAYEALDHAGLDKTRVIVVLNDNRMSIAPNVGAISQLLTRIRTGRQYRGAKRTAARVLKQTPVIGNRLLDVIDRWKDATKRFFLPSMMFEDLGWTYIGPVDGHNILGMLAALRQARALNEPVVVHVVTTKGKGVPYAEELPDKFHGGGPFDVETGKTLPGSTSYSEVFGQTMVKLAKADPRVVAITAAMPGGTGLSRFAREFPSRFFDVGIAEQHATTFAAGLAKGGLRPVFAVYSTFLQRALDQVIHDVALQGLPVVFSIDRGGLVEDGATHQGVFDLAFLRAVPNLVLGAPKDENELRHMLYTGVQHQGGPFALRYPRGTAQGVTLDAHLCELPIGRAEVLREGRDVAILALGVWAPVALRAAEQLADEGIEACVVNPRWVKPLDADLVEHLARETGGLLLVEEAALAAGFGSAVLEVLADRGLHEVCVHRLGVPDEFVPQGKPQGYLTRFGLSEDGIAAAARELVQAARNGVADERRPLPAEAGERVAGGEESVKPGRRWIPGHGRRGRGRG
ncbi:MAG: 1-deoxy-D-xylulose-5-phosphate synthase [Bacillota bacterium]